MGLKYDSDNLESDDSDRELQVAFREGVLQPGLNVELMEKPTLANYKKDELKQAFDSLAKTSLNWIERVDLSCPPAPPPKPMLAQLDEDPNTLTDIHDDFKREMRFYRQAQAAVLEGIPRLKSMGVPTIRPPDYLAQMAKSDILMKKIKSYLLAKQATIERSEKMKKMRELRKFGKKVQQEVVQKRQMEKKEMMDGVKKYRKGKTDKLDFLEEDKKGKGKQPGKKRQVRNQKFGFGGQKKRMKYNTAESSAEFGKKRNVQSSANGPLRQKGGNKNKRPGKRRRQNAKSGKRK